MSYCGLRDELLRAADHHLLVRLLEATNLNWPYGSELTVQQLVTPVQAHALRQLRQDGVGSVNVTTPG